MRRASLLLSTVAMIAGVFAATAGATVTPPGAKTGTTGAVAFGGANCTGGSFTGTWASSPTISTDMQLAFTGCRRVGGINVTITCANTGVLTAAGSTVAGTTPLSLTRLSCRLALVGAPTCNATVSGGVPATYSNAGNSLSIVASGQSLAVSGSTCASTFPNGTTSWSAVTYAVSPTTVLMF